MKLALMVLLLIIYCVFFWDARFQGTDPEKAAVLVGVLIGLAYAEFVEYLRDRRS